MVLRMWRRRRSGADGTTEVSYSTHIDYLIASIFYLGTQSWWWARTPRKMARELSLDEEKLKSVFEAFPGIFRRSKDVDEETGQHMYSLQARYAQKDGKTPPDARISYIEPLSTDKLRLLQEFVLRSAEDERAGRRAVIGNSIAVTAAVISAAAAVYVGFLKNSDDTKASGAPEHVIAAPSVPPPSH